MQILVIYDHAGYIIYQAQGNLREPVGVPFMWVDVPRGKYIERVDVSATEHTPVFADLPKTETQLLQNKIDLMQQAIDDLILAGSAL